MFVCLFVCFKLDDVKGIPEFWLTAMKNVDMLAEMIQVCGLIQYWSNLLRAVYWLNKFTEYFTKACCNLVHLYNFFSMAT